MQRNVLRATGVLLVIISVFVIMAAGQAWADTSIPSLSPDTITNYHCSFAQGAWNASDWQVVRSPYHVQTGRWVQKEDHIENHLPTDITLTEAVKSRGLSDLFASMILKKKVTGPVTISTTTSFDPEKAPLIVIANDLYEEKPGDIYPRNYVEVVIYNKGINFWLHKFENGKQGVKKAAWSLFELKGNTKYELTVRVSGNEIQATVDGHVLGWRNPEMPTSFYVGITACEGLNRFYDFDVKPVVKH